MSDQKKPVILVFVTYYLPGYKSGGPVRSIVNLVEQLSDEFTFLIVTSDREYLAIDPYSGVTPFAWADVGKARVCYIPQRLMTLRSLARFINKTPHDIMYLNSFFDPLFSIFPLFARLFGSNRRVPLVLAPRGEFSKGALALKGFKKRGYILFALLSGRYKHVNWQASSECEAADIRAVMKKVKNINIASNLPQKISNESLIGYRFRKKGTPIRVIFFSRISSKKNLHFALQVLAKVEVPVVFNIYGIIDDEKYYQACKALILSLPENVKVDFFGAIVHQRVPEILAEHELFFFPTLGENYGHVIFESLSSGTPVFISDQTPWLDLDDNGVGWVRSLDSDQDFIRIITEQSLVNVEAHIEQRQKAREYALRIAQCEERVKKNVDLFRQCLPGQG